MSTLSGWPTSPPSEPSFVLARPDGSVAYVPAAALGYDAPAPAPTTPPAPAPTVPPATTSPRGWVTKSPTKAELLLDGKRYVFVGANGVKLTVRASRAFADYDAHYRTVAPGWVDRVWFLPGMSTGEMDQIVAAARKYGARLVVSLFDHANGVKLDAVKAGWAATYRRHVETVVGRFKDDPTIIMWEIANEPPQDRGGFDLIGGAIKTLDPKHLVCTGTVPAWNDGGVAGYRNAGASSAVDVLSIHEYDTKVAGVTPHLARHLAVARDLKKPIYVGEFGIDANADGSGKGNTAGNGAVTFARRGELITAKVDAYLSTPEVCGVAYWSIGRQAEGTAADSYLPITETVGIRALQGAVKKWGRS